MLSASRYVLAGHPRNCAFCREPLTTQAHRRNNTYFCNELCADAAAEMTIRRVCRGGISRRRGRA